LVSPSSCSFTGQDQFFTETFHQDGTWYGDQGVATYNPTTYEVQQIVVQNLGTTPAVPAGQEIVLGLQDYLTYAPVALCLLLLSTPLSPHASCCALCYRPNAADTTVLQASPFLPGDSAAAVQAALTALRNVASVDVTVTTDSANTYYTVTFLSNLGHVPLLAVVEPTAGVSVMRLQAGVTEVQTITLASDVQYTREVQSFFVQVITPPHPPRPALPCRGLHPSRHRALLPAPVSVDWCRLRTRRTASCRSTSSALRGWMWSPRAPCP
jgi:hypothetical protein